jgi:hypothetical protein
VIVNLVCLDATAQAELVKRGEASPLDLVEAAIARIEAVEPHDDDLTRPPDIDLMATLLTMTTFRELVRCAWI